MSDMYADPVRFPYDASYPPSLTGGGGGPVDPFASPGDKSADFTAAYGTDPSTIADRTTLKADPVLGDAAFTGPAWHSGAYIALGDGDWVNWDGTAWADGPAPPPPPPGGGDEGDDDEGDDVVIVPDPNTMTVDQVKAWVNDLPNQGHGEAAVQEILDLERAGQNRTTLVEFLDAKLGVR